MKKVRIIVLSIVILIIIAISMPITIKQVNNIISKRKAEASEELSYIVYDNSNDQKIKFLISIKSENGIEYIKRPDGVTIYGNGKNEIKMDYTGKLNDILDFNIKANDLDEIVKEVSLTEAEIENNSIKLNITEQEGYKTIDINNKVDLSGFKLYYKIGKNSQWKEYTKNDYFLDYDVTKNNLLNSDNTITISAKAENTGTKNALTIEKTLNVDSNEVTTNVTGESLISTVENINTGDGIYTATINGETYNLKLYQFNNDLTINTDTYFGTEEDVANSSRYAQNMIVLKVNGNLTINQDALLTTYASSGGYGGPKGMFIYCTGTITNNGTINMTARGAKAVGQNVYLWKNSDGNYEYIPAVGGKGVEAKSVTNTWGLNGENGGNGNLRATGGGGTGAFLIRPVYGTSHNKTGSSSNGTSYSGGSGSGRTRRYRLPRKWS